MPPLPDVINTMIEKGIISLLIFTPLAFGTVQPWSIAIMEILSFSIFFLFMLNRILKAPGPPPSALRPPSSVIWFSSSAFRHPSSVLCLLFFILIPFQMLPLPETLLNTLSPSSLATYRNFGNAPSGTFHPITLNPDATRQALFRLLCYAAIFFVIVSHYRTKDQVTSLVKTILFMGCFLVALAIVQKAAWNGRVFWLFPVDASLSPWGPYINRDHFAGYLEMVIPLGMGLLLYRAPRITALPDAPLKLRMARFMASENFTAYSLLFLLVLTMTAALFATFSRGAILAFALSSLFFAWITSRRRSLKHKTGLLSLLAAVIFAVVVLASWDRLEERFADLEQDHISRLDVWTDAAGIVRDYPLLGTGLGTFKNAFMRYQSSMPHDLFEHAHNDYMELLTDTGFFGSLLFIGMALFFFKNTFGRWRQKRSMFGKCIGAGGLASIAAMAVHSFVDFNLHTPANAMLFAVICAISCTVIFNVTDKPGVYP